MTTLDELKGYCSLIEGLGQSKADWIERAKDKAFKTTPEQIELQESRLADLRALYRYLAAQVKAMGGADG